MALPSKIFHRRHHNTEIQGIIHLLCTENEVSTRRNELRSPAINRHWYQPWSLSKIPSFMRSGEAQIRTRHVPSVGVRHVFPNILLETSVALHSPKEATKAFEILNLGTVTVTRGWPLLVLESPPLVAVLRRVSAEGSSGQGKVKACGH